MVADFETTTDPEDCRVWLWHYVNIREESDSNLGTDLDDFMDEVLQRDLEIYFHNLAFDGSFILDWLFRNNFAYSEEKLVDGMFSTVISRESKFYRIDIQCDGHRITLKDSLKKIPLPVAAIGPAFGLAVTKGEIDYTAPRPVGYSPTDAEIDYVVRDCEVVAGALRQVLDAGMTKLTVGADSLAEYKELNKNWNAVFPVYTSDLDDEIRRAYRGGFTYADTRTVRTVIRGGAVYDVNSLYPSVMRYKRLPYGEPCRVGGDPRMDDLFICNITFTAELKKDHIPCIQIKRPFRQSDTEYLRSVPEPETLTITSVDLALWREHYDMEILDWGDSFVFDSATGFFDEYIDKWMEVKASHTGGMRTIAKLHLNSLYGKFATNTDVTQRYPVFSDNRVKLCIGSTEMRDPVYTPMGVFITAWARDTTIRAAQKNYDRFLYADTDSIHLRGTEPPVGIDVHPTRLGAWKHEGDFSEGVYVRAKQYSERMVDGSVSTHIAGLPRTLADAVEPEDLLQPRVFHGKLVPARVPGGVVLTETTFNLR